MNFEVEYNISEFKKQTDSRVWYGHMNNLVHSIEKLSLDLVVIDEINEFEKIKNNQIDIIRYHIKNKGTKLLINGMPSEELFNILYKLGIIKEIKIIDDNFLKNVNYYIRSMKINNIMNR
jgi:hypothetical protein